MFIVVVYVDIVAFLVIWFYVEFVLFSLILGVMFCFCFRVVQVCVSDLTFV